MEIVSASSLIRLWHLHKCQIITENSIPVRNKSIMILYSETEKVVGPQVEFEMTLEQHR